MSLNLKENVQNWLIKKCSDPIVNILVKNSVLTKIQLETFLLDVLINNISDNYINTEKKAFYRLNGGVSRGSFNRTLKQARKNVIRSIYTVLLLGYLGIFDSTSLDLYIEIANKLQNYVSSYKNDWKDQESSEHFRLMNLLQKELETSLNSLSKPKNVTKRS